MTTINDVSALLPTLLTPLESLKLPTPTALPSSSHSLLALKPSLLHEYTQGLLLLHAHRLRGLPIDSGEGAELVKALISIRLCVEKARPLEARAKAGIERLLRAAEQQEREGGAGAAQQNDDDDAAAQDQGLLSFRPNLAALSSASSSRGRVDAAGSDEEEADSRSGVYKPPRLAPVAYTGETRGSKSRRDKTLPRSNALLADLSSALSSTAHEESSAGLGLNGGGAAGRTSRAQKLARVEAYEEANFTRLATSAKEAKRRRADEEAVALGGARGGGAAGLHEEFSGLLRDSSAAGGKKRKGSTDAYDGLRKRRDGALDRARMSNEGGKSREKSGGTFEVPVQRGNQKSAFDKAVKGHSKRNKK